MSWQELQAPAKARHVMSAWATLPDFNASRARSLQLFFDAAELAEGLPWFKIGATVNVLLGDDEHAGQLRIVRGDRQLLTRGGGVGREVVRVAVPVLRERRNAPFHRSRLQIEFDGSDLIVTMPPEARRLFQVEVGVEVEPMAPARMIAVPPRVPDPPAPAPPPPVRAPFSMIANVPDPAVALQAAQGGRVR